MISQGRTCGDGGSRSRAAAAVAVLFVMVFVSACGEIGSFALRNVNGPQTADSPAAVSSVPLHDGQVADPVRIRIPEIGVDAAIDPVDVDEHGALSVPDTDHRTGWWQGGPEPGERGPAVITGHVDSYQGPAVFVGLADLRAGDRIFIDRVDGTTAVFVTERVDQYGKNAFPTQAIYGATDNAQLRLITCGGTFDPSERSYNDNLVLYAHETN